jgi:prepilin-type N-terminal cleavage/methylation domain-containing protein
MPTSTTSACDDCRRSLSPNGRASSFRSRAAGRAGQAGFTLIEIGVVLLVIGIVIGMVVPRFRDNSHAELVAASRKLALTFRFLRHEAILNGRTYRLNYDIDQQRYWITSADEIDGEAAFQREDGLLARDVVLTPPVGISDIVLPLVGGKLQEGFAYTHFYPDGYVDLTVVHLDNGREAYTLWVDSLTGRVHVTAGYQDFDFSA